MNAATLIITGINMVNALVVLIHAFCVINQMGRKTGFGQRISYLLLATGAAASILFPFFFGRPSPLAEGVILAALSVKFLLQWPVVQRLLERSHLR